MHKAQYPDSYDGSCLHGLGWYQHNESDGETYGGHDGAGSYAKVLMRYSDKVGVILFWNQHSFIYCHRKGYKPEEKEAFIGIKKALFEKADEL